MIGTVLTSPKMSTCLGVTFGVGWRMVYYTAQMSSLSSILAISFFFRSLVASAYTSIVVSMSLCPRISCNALMLIPLSHNLVAKVCLKLWHPVLPVENALPLLCHAWLPACNALQQTFPALILRLVNPIKESSFFFDSQSIFNL